ncbi:Mechanosensitive ion channel protein 6 [Striga hermonthica]|uniref:Mechanosensitive ion channel protein n=1 Tax=Striga hermonthica TaxID=68872 RepID=A0A9N7RF28_STRHE|nr:Mechanosensitive ion channel protein 6 [Striga hermonthica]
MDFSSACKKSFKSSSSYKHGRKISIGRSSEEDAIHEQQPILSDHNRDSSSSSATGAGAASHIDSVSGPSEVIVKVDDGDDPSPVHNRNGVHYRESSLDIWGDEPRAPMQPEGFDSRKSRSPPSKLIGVFLNQQNVGGGELRLDMDMEMDDLHLNRGGGGGGGSNTGPQSSLPPANPNYYGPTANNHSFRNPSELKTTMEVPSAGASNVVDIRPDEPDNIESSSDEDVNRTLRRRSSNVDTNNNGGLSGNTDGQVLKCTSIQRRVSNLGRMKTRSRLIDPPEVVDRRSGLIPKSGQLRSGMPGRNSAVLGKPVDEEEDDPLFDEDLPDDFKKGKFDALTILQWISLILIVAALASTLAISELKRKKLRGLSIWKWEVLVLVLICGRLVSGWGIRIVVFFIERNFFMRKRVLYFVYGVRKAVQNCIWLGLVLIAWHYMFDHEVEGSNKFLQYVNKIMVCMLVGTLLWLVKTLMVKVLASSFHVSTFFDRIQETLFNQYIIETLSGPPLIEMRNHQEEEERTMAEVCRLQNAGATLPADLRCPPFQAVKSGKAVGGGGGLPPRLARGLSFGVSGQLTKNDLNEQGAGISIDKLQNLNHKNVSAWSMKRLIKFVKNGVLITLDERALGSSQGDETAMQIRSEREAKAAARNIFRNVARPRAKFIHLEDLMRFVKEEEALKTLNIVEGSIEGEKISKASLKNWVVNTFIERRALALTLNDTKTAVDKLHRMVNVIVAIIILVVCLIILGIATSKFMLYISSQIVIVAFIFGNSCKTVFEAIIFVFVIHPFDVGDRCEVDGVQMIVEEMNILTTVFLRYDNQKIIYPNVTLATRPISNYYRSPDMGDSIEFAVHIATPAEKIATIKQRITSYIENRSDHWYPEPSVVVMELQDLRTLKLSVWMRHRMNHQNMGEKWKRRAVLVEELVKILKELDIEYRLYPVDVNIREMPPLNPTRMPPAWITPPAN